MMTHYGLDSADEGTASHRPLVTVLLATRGRAAALTRALRCVEAACAAVPGTTEVVIIDNGSTDGTAAVLERWVAGGPNRKRLYVGEGGKSRALNQGLRAASSSLLAFTDDDVEVRADWLCAALDFFADHPGFVAATGRVLVPPDVTIPEVLDRIAYLRTLPLFDAGGAVRETHHLYGCNMVVRRVAFDRVGVFNHRLGPGASGLHEDGDLARRILAAGMRIGYMPSAVVYHAVEPERLTLNYFRTLHVRDARSRFEMNQQRSLLACAGHLMGSALVCALWAILCNPNRRMRALGRTISHAELLRLCWNSAPTSAAPSNLPPRTEPTAVLYREGPSRLGQDGRRERQM